MRRLSKGVSAGVMTLALTIGACSPGDTDSGDEPGSPNTDPRSHPNTDGPGPVGLGAADVLRPANGLTVLGKSHQEVRQNTYAVPLTVTPDGKIVVSVARDNLRNPLNLNQARIALQDPTSGRLDVISTGYGREGNQAGYADATRRWVTWIETPSTNLAQNPWTLYSHDLKSDRTRKIATYPRIPKYGAPRVSGETVPTISGDRAYLAAVSGVKDGSLQPSVYSVPLNGRDRMRLDYPGGFLPEAGNGTLVTLTQRHGRAWSIVEHDTDTNERRVIANGTSKISSVNHAGDVTGWITRRAGHSEVNLRIGDEENKTVVRTTRELSYPSLTTRYFQFETETGTVYYYDLDTRHLRRLPGRRNISLSSSYGNYLVWHGEGDQAPSIAARLTPE